MTPINLVIVTSINLLLVMFPENQNVELLKVRIFEAADISTLSLYTIKPFCVLLQYFDSDNVILDSYRVLYNSS